MQPLVRLTAPLAALALLLAACGETGSPDAAATVNGEDVPLSQVENRYQSIADNPQFAAQLEADEDGAMEAQFQAQILTELIESELVRQGAEELGVEVTDDDVAEQRAEIAEQMGGEEALEMAVEQQGLTEEDLDQLLRDLAYREAVLAELVGDDEVTDEEIETFFDEQEGRYDSAQARHILVDSEDEAQEIREEIEDGADFEELAEDRSEDPGSAEQGGELPEFGRGEMVPEFEEAVFDAAPGDLVGPVESDFGFHVIEVLEVTEAELDEVSDEIRAELEAEQEFGVFDEWLAEQRAEAEVTVNPRFGEWDDEAGQVVPDIDEAELMPEPEEVPEEAEEEPEEGDEADEGADDED